MEKRYFAKLKSVDNETRTATFEVIGDYRPEPAAVAITTNLGGANDGLELRATLNAQRFAVLKMFAFHEMVVVVICVGDTPVDWLIPSF